MKIDPDAPAYPVSLDAFEDFDTHPAPGMSIRAKMVAMNVAALMSDHEGMASIKAYAVQHGHTVGVELAAQAADAADCAIAELNKDTKP